MFDFLQFDISSIQNTLHLRILSYSEILLKCSPIPNFTLLHVKIDTMYLFNQGSYKFSFFAKQSPSPLLHHNFYQKYFAWQDKYHHTFVDNDFTVIWHLSYIPWMLKVPNAMIMILMSKWNRY